MSEHLKEYPDEKEIEEIFDRIYDMAWSNIPLKYDGEDKLLNDIEWMLDVWSKNYLGNDKLTQIITKHYLQKLPSSHDKMRLYRELDLAICFFQHYIYAFEEFMTREFRDSVIRCGLICERFVNRLAIASGHLDALQIRNFEDRANKVMSILSNQVNNIHYLVNRMKYIYSQRTKKGAHDTGAAGILIAKSCISEIPTAYLEYLDALENIGYECASKDELITLVNSTVKIGSTLIVVKVGEPTKPETILVSLYSQKHFATPRTFAEIKETFQKRGHNPPVSSLWKALDSLCKKKMLTRKSRGLYVQRTPPEKFFSKEIID